MTMSNWIFVGCFGLAIFAGIIDKERHSPFWPPILASAFAAAFITKIIDALRTGRVSYKFVSAERSAQPTVFKIVLFLNILMAAFCSFMALKFIFGGHFPAAG
jgi:hypothetical protein